MQCTRCISKYFKRLSVLLALISLSGCGQTLYGVVKIESIPPGAEVINLKDDTHLGMTPLLVTWESDEDEAKHATVELRKVGYVDEIASFWVKMRHKTKEAATLEPQPVIIELKKRN
ncbi:hypothetical protein HNV12_12435 [Methanococcoides sp. SA1]|nr:hypothetical protein [Methanococcoides sp. SA1]